MLCIDAAGSTSCCKNIGSSKLLRMHWAQWVTANAVDLAPMQEIAAALPLPSWLPERKSNTFWGANNSALCSRRIHGEQCILESKDNEIFVLRANHELCSRTVSKLSAIIRYYMYHLWLCHKPCVAANVVAGLFAGAVDGETALAGFPVLADVPAVSGVLAVPGNPAATGIYLFCLMFSLLLAFLLFSGALLLLVVVLLFAFLSFYLVFLFVLVSLLLLPHSRCCPCHCWFPSWSLFPYFSFCLCVPYSKHKHIRLSD